MLRGSDPVTAPARAEPWCGFPSPGRHPSRCWFRALDRVGQQSEPPSSPLPPAPGSIRIPPPSRGRSRVARATSCGKVPHNAKSRMMRPIIWLCVRGARPNCRQVVKWDARMSRAIHRFLEATRVGHCCCGMRRTSLLEDDNFPPRECARPSQAIRRLRSR